MKIAILGTRGILTEYSGIETAVRNISLRLAKKEHEIYIYCRKTSRRIPRKIPKNIHLIYLPAIKNKYLETLSHCLLSTIHVLFINAEIVHFHALGPALFSFIPRIFRKKTIVTIHALDWKRKKWGALATNILKFCEYSAVYSPNLVIVVAKSLKRYFKNKYGKNTIYIPNGVDIPKEPNSGEITYKKYILFVGRITPEKEIETLIKAHNYLNKDLELVIAGTDSYNKKYSSYLRKISSENVQFKGFIKKPEIYDIFRRSYLFILPSEIEGSPLALLEAMSFSKCVVVSNIEECREIIGQCGLTFQVGNYKDLSEKISYLINHPEIATELGKKARLRIMDKYNWEKITYATEQTYKRLITNEKN